MKHPYLPNSSRRKEMFSEIKFDSIEELFSDIPDEVKMKTDYDLPDGETELQVKRDIRRTLEKNKDVTSFLGEGIYPHYVPSHIQNLLERSEFHSSYTPYQPEISQGMLQSLFEYQSLMGEILEMDIVNSSMYDWSTSLGEAALMSLRAKRNKNKFLIPELTHPERKAVLETYIKGREIELIEIDYNDGTGQLDLDDLRDKIDDDTAGVYIENPSYLGFLEEKVDEIEDIVHGEDSLFIVGVDPTSLGLVRPPGSYNADVVIGEASYFGNPMNFGGPLVGIFGIRNDRSLVRKMPGRLIGVTEDEDDQKGYVMALQTREQHIRREKATSNICSNEALTAVASAIYMGSLGNEGLNRLSETIMKNNNYLMKRINELNKFKAPIFNSTHFKEFTVAYEGEIEKIYRKLLEKGLQIGKPKTLDGKEFSIISVTELHTREEIDKLVNAMEEIQ